METYIDTGIDKYTKGSDLEKNMSAIGKFTVFKRCENIFKVMKLRVNEFQNKYFPT